MKKYNLLITNFISIFYLLITFNLIIYKSISISNTLFIAISSITTALILNIISRLTNNNKINKIINIILLLSLSIVIIAQFIHYKFYSSFFSIHSLLRRTSQAFSFFDAILKIILRNWYYILILFIPLLSNIIFNKKLNYEKLNSYNISKLLIFIVSLNVLFTLLISINKTGIYSKYNLYYNIYYPTKNTKEFGLLKSMAIDFKRYITNFEDKIIINYEKNKKEYNNNKYNITNIDFDDSNNKINEINEYIKNIIPTNKNKYTGIFKDKNLIFIMGESVYFDAISKEDTPTLYKITNNGFVFNNFYTPLYYTSTSDGEYTTLTSLLPKEGTWSLEYSYNNDMSYSLPGMFKNNKYNTYAYHNNDHDFFNRNLTHPNLGFNKFNACGNGLEEKINCDIWPQSDYEMINKTYQDYKNNNKFFTY